MQNLTFYKDFQLYTLDVEQRGKFYSKALKGSKTYTLAQRELWF